VGGEVTNLIESAHVVNITPDSEAERRLFIQAATTANEAVIVPSRLRLHYTSPTQLRLMRDLFDTLASRMEAIRNAEAALANHEPALESPETPPGA
jgi:hypothetical protein